MADKQIIKTLKNIHDHCIKTQCEDCVFSEKRVDNTHSCQIRILAEQLNIIPIGWDMRKIKEILSE